MHGIVGQTKFTQNIIDVVRRIDGKSPQKDSLFEQASEYFLNADESKERIARLSAAVKKADDALKASSKRALDENKNKLKKAKIAYKAEFDKQEKERLARLQNVMNVCEKVIRLSEGENWEKTQLASARVLGTLFLAAPTEGMQLAREKQRFKPLYKAVLAMRLVDKLLSQKHVILEYISKRYKANERYIAFNEDLNPFMLEVAAPIITAAIFQDVGLLHPDAIALTSIENGNSYKLLDKAQRIELLKLNHKHTMDYIKNGLGAEKYIGNVKSERDIFDKKQIGKLKLSIEILVGALNPKRGVGNLVKIPQIYASFIFSAKPEQTIRDLPKACLLLQKTAEKASLSQHAVDALIEILGHFPQGYGITYIPKTSNDKLADIYEYAIVCELNPSNPYEPVCRTATRQLTFIPNGTLTKIPASRNLYYPEPKKLLEKIDPERLKQILKKLVSNYDERVEIELIPSCWNPHTFFQYKKMQNLWKST